MAFYIYSQYHGNDWYSLQTKGATLKNTNNTNSDMHLLMILHDNFLFESKYFIISSSYFLGIHRGLVVTIPCSQALFRMLNSTGSLRGLAWSLYKCAALWRTVYGSSASKKTL